MELVYPIYLDTPMMTAFLASLEGGILEEAAVEGKTSKTKASLGKATFSAKVSDWISTLADINAQADVSRQISDNLESQYKGTVRFPNAALFIRLRNKLIEEKIIKKISSKKDLNKLSIGDLVEINGNAQPSPNYQIKKALNQLVPIAIPAIELQVKQLESQLAELKSSNKNSKGNKQITIGDETFDISTVITFCETQIREKQNQLVNIQGIENVSSILFTEESASNIIFESADFKSVCKVYSAFARNEKIEEIYNANWICLGKVIGKLEAEDSYDLFKGLPVGLLAKNIFSSMVEGLKTEELEINVSDPIISGEGLIIATLAIFA